jgi:predicted nucleic acid-binding protein
MKLCDTSVLVDIDRGGIDETVRRLDEQGRHAISMVSVTELRLGVTLGYDEDSEAHREAVDDLDRLLARFEIKPVSRAVAVAAADIIATLKSRGEPLDDLHDVYVASTARTEQVPVLTEKVVHFDRIEGCDVDYLTAF